MLANLNCWFVLTKKNKVQFEFLYTCMLVPEYFILQNAAFRRNSNYYKSLSESLQQHSLNIFQEKVETKIIM